MVHPTEIGGASFLRGQHWLTEHVFPQPWIVLPLLIGLVFGSVFGLISSLPAGLSSFISVDFAGHGFFDGLWQGSRFVAAALLLSTTFLGFALLPGLAALVGLLLGSGVSSAFRLDGFSGLLLAFVSFGIPALLGLPAFLLAASDGAKCSLQLLRCFTKGARPLSEGHGEFPRHIALIAFLCLLEAFYAAFLLPILLNAFR